MAELAPITARAPAFVEPSVTVCPTTEWERDPAEVWRENAAGVRQPAERRARSASTKEKGPKWIWPLMTIPFAQVPVSRE